MCSTDHANENEEPLFHCEGCSKPIMDGDKYHCAGDVEFCEECAPTYADLIADQSGFRTSDDEPVKFSDAMRAYNKHIAFGGSPDDKMVKS